VSTRRGGPDQPPGRLEAIEARLAELEAEVAGLRSGMAADRGPPGSRRDPGPRFAAVYPAFQDQFRGTQAEVTAKLSVYLPDVDRLVRKGGVVDVGPGRGEWLALLAGRRIPAHGVDTHEELAGLCRARGLQVILGRAADHLASLAPGTVDMVTAFHLIEHLGTEELIELILAARQALRPGGCLLLETPNPTNLVMASCDFYNDPTHRSPLPPDLTVFLVTAHGFGQVEVRHLNPGQAPGEAGPADDVARRLYGPQDYAVLAYRPECRR
jgi:O-antigen chain-terminating methyltransferase